MELFKGQDIVILLHGGNEYIQVVDDAIGDYQLQPEDVAVIVKETQWTMKEDERVIVDLNEYIQDDDDINYYHIVGARPRNIVRR